MDHLAQGDSGERGVNVLAFGLPGTGKTHALCAIGHRLVQELLAAKRDLALPRQLRKLDSFDFLLIDDLGYLLQGIEESEILFTLIAERYERRSLGHHFKPGVLGVGAHLCQSHGHRRCD